MGLIYTYFLKISLNKANYEKEFKKREEIKNKIQESYFSIKYAREEYSEFMTSQEITVAWNIEQDLKKYLENIDKNNFYLREKK